MSKDFNIVERVSGDSKHHLFNQTDVKNKLMELFGIPETKREKDQLRRRTLAVMTYIPVFIIKREDHEEYHKKYPDLNGTKSPDWIKAKRRFHSSQKENKENSK